MSKENDSDSSSRLSTDEKQAAVQLSSEGEEERKYLTGLKLFLVCAAVTLVCFLVLLDTAIIVTVCFYCGANNSDLTYPFLSCLGHSSNHDQISFTSRLGLVWQLVSDCKVRSLLLLDTFFEFHWQYTYRFLARVCSLSREKSILVFLLRYTTHFVVTQLSSEETLLAELTQSSGLSWFSFSFSNSVLFYVV